MTEKCESEHELHASCDVQMTTGAMHTAAMWGLHQLIYSQVLKRVFKSALSNSLTKYVVCHSEPS